MKQLLRNGLAMLAVYAALVLELGGPPLLPVQWARPDWLSLAGVAIALWMPGAVGIAWSGIAGFVRDGLAASGPLGPQMGLAAIVSLTVQSLLPRRGRPSLLRLTAVAAIGVGALCCGGFLLDGWLHAGADSPALRDVWTHSRFVSTSAALGILVVSERLLERCYQSLRQRFHSEPAAPRHGWVQ